MPPLQKVRRRVRKNEFCQKIFFRRVAFLYKFMLVKGLWITPFQRREKNSPAKIVEMYVFGQKSNDFLDNIHSNPPNPQFDFVLLITLRSCNFKNIFSISKILYALKSYESETYMFVVYSTPVTGKVGAGTQT